MSETVSEILSSLFVLSIDVIVFCFAWRHYRIARHTLEEKYQTFWPRFFAPAIDMVILWPIIGVMGVVGDVAEKNPEILRLSPKVLLAISIASFLIQHLYVVFMHGKKGQTVGKMVSRVKVVRFDTEGEISLKTAFIRESIPILFLLPLFFVEAGSVNLTWLFGVSGGWFFLEVVTMLTNDKRRALHDFIAGTVVIRTSIQQ